MKEGRPPLPPLKSSPFSKVGSIIFDRPPIFFCYEPQTWHNEKKKSTIYMLRMRRLLIKIQVFRQINIFMQLGHIYLAYGSLESLRMS